MPREYKAGVLQRVRLNGVSEVIGGLKGWSWLSGVIFWNDEKGSGNAKTDYILFRG